VLKNKTGNPSLQGSAGDGSWAHACSSDAAQPWQSFSVGKGAHHMHDTDARSSQLARRCWSFTCHDEIRSSVTVLLSHMWRFWKTRASFPCLCSGSLRSYNYEKLFWKQRRGTLMEILRKELNELFWKR
jgi:hypothetical protein